MSTIMAVRSLLRRPRLVPGVALAAAASLLGHPVPVDATSPPARTTKVGAWAAGMTADPGLLDALESELGHGLDVASHFYGFGDWFPTATERTLAAQGRRDVLISWDMGPSRFSEWADGRHDEYLETIGRLASDHPFPLYVRPWPEMNGDWQPFMPTATGDRPRGGTPAEFRRAWRHVVDTVRAAGGTNIRWVFNPYATTDPHSADVRELWPGRDHVDVLGMDGYNWGGGPQGWQEFDEVFGPMYAILTSLDPSLPVWICEFASREPSIDDGAPVLESHSKAEWISRAFASESLPRVEALVWFHENKERDWRIDSSPGALRAFRAALADPSQPSHADPSQPSLDSPRPETAGPSPLTVTPTSTPDGAVRKKRPGRSSVRARVVRSDRIRVRVKPRQRTRIVAKRKTTRGWKRFARSTTRRSGRATVSLPRTWRKIRVVAPRLRARAVLRHRDLGR